MTIVNRLLLKGSGKLAHGEVQPNSEGFNGVQFVSSEKLEFEDVVRLAVHL